MGDNIRIPRYFCYGCGKFQKAHLVDVLHVCNHYVDNKHPVKHCICVRCLERYPGVLMENLPRAVKVDHQHTFPSQEELDINLKKFEDEIAKVFAKYKKLEEKEDKNIV